MTISRTNPNEPGTIAPCGINCRVCRRAVAGDKKACPGCRGEDIYKSISCVNCRIKNCEKLVQGKFEFCFECDEYPCARLSHLDERYRLRYATSPIDNLNRIHEIGVEHFMAEEDKKWTCPECGGRLCMHKPQCPTCGYAYRN
jgi:hypothetical protein